MERIAGQIGVPWPIDKDASQEEIAERMTKLQTAIFGSAIDRVLQAPQPR